jgi:hypothetical protein
MLVSIKGSPDLNFRRSLETRKLSIILPAADELQQINPADRLEILVLMAEERDPRFERSAARWIGRILTETPPLTLRGQVGASDGRAAPALQRVAKPLRRAA